MQVRRTSNIQPLSQGEADNKKLIVCTTPTSALIRPPPVVDGRINLF